MVGMLKKSVGKLIVAGVRDWGSWVSGAIYRYIRRSLCEILKPIRTYVRSEAKVTVENCPSDDQTLNRGFQQNRHDGSLGCKSDSGYR